MKTFIEYAPFLVPLVILQFTLAITAIIHIFKHPNYKFGNRIMWVLIALFINILGPILYFTIGRGDNE